MKKVVLSSAYISVDAEVIITDITYELNEAYTKADNILVIAQLSRKDLRILSNLRLYSKKDIEQVSVDVIGHFGKDLSKESKSKKALFKDVAGDQKDKVVIVSKK